jgi:hypothetical protein
VNSNLEFATGQFVYISGKLLNIAGVKLGLWVGRCHIPFGLRNGTKRNGDSRCRDQ